MGRDAGVAAALLCALAAAGCTEVTEEVEVGFQGEARSNSMLAAQRLLEHFGAEVEVVRGFETPGDTRTVLLAEGDAFQVRGPRLEALLDFASRGGRAVVCLGSFEEEPLGFLSAIDDESAGWSMDFPPNALLEELSLELRASFGKSDGQKSAPLGHDIEPILSAGLIDRAPPLHDSPVAVVTRGAGAIAVTNSGQYFVNSHLADADHAGLLMSLVGWPETPDGVMISFTEPVGLMELIRERAPWTLPAAALLVALWLWRSSRSFGPTAALPLAPPGDLRSHLTRVGELLWRVDGGPLALQSARALATRRLVARRPDLAHAEPGAIVRAVAADLDAPPADVERALFGATHLDTRGLLSALNILQSLSDGARPPRRPALDTEPNATNR